MASGTIKHVVTGDGSWKMITLPGNAATNITIARGYRGLFFTGGPDSSIQYGIYGISSTSGGMGSSACKTIASASSLSITTSGDTLKITNSGASGAFAIFLTLVNAEPTV